MKIFAYKDVGALYELLESRTRRGNAEISGRVASILARVAEGGDAAVKAVTRETDGVELASLELPPAELDRLAAQTPPALYETMEKAAANIRRYHEKQKSTGYELREPGRLLGRIVRPLRRVGVYVPGGTAAYPSTVLMNCIPAAVAGVEEIVIATPPKRGGIAPAVAAAAKIAGVGRVVTVGGAQAVAALAYGTETLPRVDKIVGPGNIYVAEAKKQLFGRVDIDMIAGPSEVLIVADESADAEFAAADLLSQLEHDAFASAILVTTSAPLAERVGKALEAQAATLSRTEIVSAVWTRRLRSRTRSHPSILKSLPPTRRATLRACATRAASFSVPIRPNRSAIISRAPTTSCRPTAPRASPRRCRWTIL